MTATSPPLTRRLLTAARELRHLPRVLRLVWRAAGWVTPLWLALLIIAGLLPAVSVLLIRIAVDGLVAIVGDPATAADPWTRLQPVLPALIGVAAVLLTIEVSSAVARWLRTVQAERVTDHVAAAIHTQAARLDLAVYDDPSYFDRLHRARLYAHDRPTQVLEQLGTALQSLLTLFAMVVVLVPFGWWLPALLIVGTAPTLLLVIGHQIRAYHFRHRTTTRERRIGYYDWLLTAAEPAAELRLFALKDRLRARWRQLRDGLRRERLTLAAAEARAEVLAGLLALGALGGGMLWMVRELVRGAVSLGDVALFYQALDHSQRALRALLTTLAEIYGSVLDLGDFFAYLELEPSIDDPATPVALEPEAPRQAIRFHDVGFTYPGSREPVLQRLDLDLPAARTPAWVGPNGRGKSTII
ncbi:MAG: ABC transporter ATP-binding protein, partial [Acidobacteriota bacterium]